MIQRKIFLITTIAGLSLLACFVFYFVFLQSGINSGLDQITASATAFYDQTQAKSADFPISLKIPKIGVDAAIEYVGTAKNGAVGVPKGPVNVAWFKESAIPGTTGIAVIDGHSGWKDGIHAVFDDLHKLKVGDKVFVTDKSGLTITFVVRKIKKYDTKADASDLLNSTDGLAHLNLITCAGVWNAEAKTHSERMIVFTDKVE
jgi:LPXTG-site transpeptidase (sortase) family protein